MQTTNEPTIKSSQRRPWNKGKFIGPKPPLQPRHVWAIRKRLQFDERIRDLALFNLAIDSKLRGCDVVSIKVEDVAPHGYAIDRATVRQKKTGRPVKFEIGMPADSQELPFAASQDGTNSGLGPGAHWQIDGALMWS